VPDIVDADSEKAGVGERIGEIPDRTLVTAEAVVHKHSSAPRGDLGGVPRRQEGWRTGKMSRHRHRSWVPVDRHASD